MSILYLYLVLSVLVSIIATLRGRAWWRWLLIALFITPLIAGLLVMALPPEPRAYPDGLYPSPVEGEPTVADSAIRIIRMSGYSDRYRPYEIFVNGILVGVVAHDSVVDFEVPHGELIVEARAARGGSRPLLIETAAGQRTDIYLAKHGGRVRALWADLFGSNKYLTLRQRSR
jgi:hypothetical protein